MPSFDDHKITVLFYIWKDASEPGNPPGFDWEEIKAILPPTMVSGITHAAIRSLLNDNLLEEDNAKYYLTEFGIRRIEGELQDPYSLISGIAKTAEGSQALPHVIPASDRLVSLDHNGDEYKEAIAALDAAVAAFREDQSLSNQWGSEKSVLLRTLEAGREILNEATVRTATVYTTVVNPLRIICERYTDAIAAGLVTATVDHLLPLLERAVSSIRALLG
jgi:hypothetical protein